MYTLYPDNILVIIPLTKEFFTIPVRQRILYYVFLKGFLHSSSTTTHCLLLLSQHMFLLFQSDQGFFTIPLTKGCFTIPVRLRILYHSSQRNSSLFQSDKGFVTIPLTKDFVTLPVRQKICIFLSQRISSLLPSDKKDLQDCHQL